jgi:tetratricopeptide (TPR) repeat protein
MFRTTSFFFS